MVLNLEMQLQFQKIVFVLKNQLEKMVIILILILCIMIKKNVLKNLVQDVFKIKNLREFIIQNVKQDTEEVLNQIKL